MIPPHKAKILEYVALLLQKNDIKFQVTGGLAAILYGAKRDLIDIDIDISKIDKERVAEIFSQYITEPWNNKLEGDDDLFDCWILKLQIEGVDIDISQIEDFRIRIKGGGWVQQKDTLDFNFVTFETLSLPVQNKSDLIAYKRSLDREVDIFDVEAIK